MRFHNNSTSCTTIKLFITLFPYMLYNKSMKKYLSIIIISLFVTANFFALTKLKFANGTTLAFEACSDGSIRFEAKGKKSYAPVKEFELKRKPAATDFTKNSDGTYQWNNYCLKPAENGYVLFYDGKELYSSVFSEDKKLLKELRNWKTATEFYGFGEASRKVSLRNQSFTIYNESKYGDHAYVFIPFYITNENTAVYYNAGGKDKIYFQDGQDSQLYRSEYKRIECFVGQNNSAKEAVQKFYAETESSCMLPKWAFGYIQSKYGYKNSEEVTELVNEFEKRNIPLSAVVLDLYWFKRMGDISWTSKDYSDYKEMDAQMESKGVKLITITEPFFTTESENYKELESIGLLCKDKSGKIAVWRDWWCLDDKEGSVFNPLGKKAAAFMGKKYAAMLDSGIEGFWTDLGEPEKVPETLKYGKYNEIDFHNYYNYYWSKALYEGVHSLKPDTRLFILSRSAGTGSGKFNVSVWSGDVSVSWPSLANQIAYGINAGLSGLAYWGSDVGGFVQPESPAELYVRWQQFGAFTPVYRAHGTAAREPWIHTEKEERIVGDLIRTRTKLLPYIYSTARQTMQGIPMMRPMFYEDKATPAEFVNSQFMFGDSILVAPVVKEAAATTERELYLPKGNWYNFYTMEKVSAAEGKSITVKTTIENIPVYIKEGAIIPAEQNNINYIFVIPAEGVENSFTLYNDDGITEQYKNGNYSETTFTLKGKKLSVTLAGNDSFRPSEFVIAIPDVNGKFKTSKFTVEKLKNGIEL